MSELEDLGDIADACAIGTELSLRPSLHKGGRRPGAARCGSPDHMRGPNLRIYTAKGRKTRVVCKLCDKLRRRGDRPKYSAEGYPL